MWTGFAMCTVWSKFKQTQVNQEKNVKIKDRSDIQMHGYLSTWLFVYIDFFGLLHLLFNLFSKCDRKSEVYLVSWNWNYPYDECNEC